MSIITLIDNNLTDKNEGHSYAELYDVLFEPIQSTAHNVLEVGIDKGGSILLWKNYFSNAAIYGVDCNKEDCINADVLQFLKDAEKVVLLTSVNAYDPLAIQMINAISEYNFEQSKPKFDVIIDDGPHTLTSQKKFLQLYIPLLSDNGIIIIEDIQNIDYCNDLVDIVPDELKKYVQVYDLRDAKDQPDDILFVINKLSPMEVSQVYDGRIMPLSSGKWLHGKWIKNYEPLLIQPMHPNQFLLEEVKEWARNKNPYYKQT
jgi:cephalosporin hydroxylase